MIKNLFIVGAGFTKAAFPTAPLNDDLLKQVVGEKPDNSPLGKIWKAYGISNVETLLTRFDLDLVSGHGPFSISARNDVSEQLAAFVSQYRFQNDVLWLRPILKVISDNDVIVSLNYDCFLEGFLDFHDAWSPKGGYHIIENMLADNLPDNTRNIRILKIHGSESFRISSFFDKPESVAVNYEVNPGLFPRSGKNSHLGGGVDSRPYVIAPSFTKQFVVELQHLLLDAIRFAKVARNLIIIGCSLRPEDSHLWLVLTSFMKNRAWKRKRTFIVSPSACDIKQRIEQFWGRKIFTEQNLVAIGTGLEPALLALQRSVYGPV
jgi:SIR2-like domain